MNFLLYVKLVVNRYPRFNNTSTKQEKTTIAHNTEESRVFYHQQSMTAMDTSLLFYYPRAARPGILKKVLTNKLRSEQQVMERKIVHINLRQKIRYKEYTISYVRERLRISVRERVE